jgi:hypothetical protein
VLLLVSLLPVIRIRQLDLYGNKITSEGMDILAKVFTVLAPTL